MQQPIVLVINCGSSSLKFALINTANEEEILSGLAEKLGGAGACVTIKHDGAKIPSDLAGGAHAEALRHIIAYLDEKGLRTSVGAVGHRVVHGGEAFTQSVKITPEVLKAIEAVSHLAPLHNPANLVGIRAAMECFPDLAQVAVFDTAFHQSIPKEAYLYAVPMKWYREYGVRRYGFHGTSHRYVSEEASRVLSLPLDHSAFICAHLGNGASATAVLNGKSVDTTMGLTPLEGLVMGTRSGDVDPGLLPFIGDIAKMDLQQINNALNKESGLLGLSELSNDCRELEQAKAAGHEGATTALDVFVFRLARYIGALAMSLPRIDALIFTGGIGENSATIRAMVADRLGVLGFALDPQANAEKVRGEAGVISKKGTTPMLVINTNEELMIALDTAALA
jgi:acetate kinase